MRYARVAFLLIALVGVIFFLLSVPKLIKINKFICQNQYGTCPEALVRKLNAPAGQNLGIAKKEIAKILKEEVLIADYSIQFKIPDILQINCLVKKPKFALKVQNESEFFLVDAKGRVLSKSSETNLPTLKIEKVENDHVFSLKILDSMFYLYQIKEGEVSGDSLIINHPQGIKLIFPLSGDPAILIGSARLVLSKLNTDTETSKIGNVTTLDLRFKNPVLK